MNEVIIWLTNGRELNYMTNLTVGEIMESYDSKGFIKLVEYDNPTKVIGILHIDSINFIGYEN